MILTIGVQFLPFYEGIRNKIKKIRKKFLRGFERDGAKTSGFFKLQKIRTGKNIVLSFYLHSTGHKNLFGVLCKYRILKVLSNICFKINATSVLL